ncbi:unnamed protein product, partial [Effrenium voratum]
LQRDEHHLGGRQLGRGTGVLLEVESEPALQAPQTRGVGAAAGPPLAPGAERPHGPLAGRGGLRGLRGSATSPGPRAPAHAPTAAHGARHQ